MKSKRLVDTGRLKTLGSLMFVTVLAMSLFAADVLALEAELSKDLKLSVDTTLSYTSNWRVQKANAFFTNPASGLDYSQGDANFDAGDQTLSTMRALVDLDLNYKDDYGIFVRASGFYDTVYADDDKFKSDGTLYINDLDKFQDANGSSVDLLDAFAYGSFRIGDVPVTLRVGRQTIFWGESLLIFGSVATAMNPLDITLANIPGAETKELIMPTGRAYASVSTPDDKLTLAVNYKWEWEKSKVDEAGAYFATSNALDDSVSQLLVFPRGADVNEEDGGEYGVAVRYSADNGDEYGLYYLNYREALPLLQTRANAAAPAGLEYYLDYEEDVKMYAATFSSVFAPTNSNYAVEVSYRPDFQVRLNNPAVLPPMYASDKLLQVQGNVIHLFGDIPGADACTGYFAWAYNTVFDHSSAELHKERWATGGKAKIIFDYFNVVDGLDMKVPVSVGYNPKGRTSYGLSGLSENANSVSIGLEGTYLGVYKAGINYVAYFGNTGDNSKTDRDFVSATVKYTF